MSEIALHPTSTNCMTCVPDYFIDDFMVEANGEYVKIYLYILRCLGRSTSGFSIGRIADALDHTQKDVRKALHYWEEAGLMELEYDKYNELCGIFLKDPSIEEPALSGPTLLSVSPIAAIPQISAPEPDISLDQELQEVLYFAEKIIGRPLSNDNIERIIFWHDHMNLDWDLVEYIVEISCERSNGSFSYMDKIASNYAAEGVSTVEQAKQLSNAFLSVSFAVKSAFGITGRNLGKREIDYVKTWSDDYGFTNDIITEACNRTLLNLGKANFEYTDSILSSWRQSGVRSLTDIASLDENHARTQKQKNKPTQRASVPLKNFKERERTHYDYKELENKMLKS